MVSWCSKKQTSVALNIAEVEYIVASVASSETSVASKFTCRDI